MNYSYLRLRSLFKGIVTTGLAATAGCDDGVRSSYPADAFDESICPRTGADWIDAITPEPPVDALLLREWVVGPFARDAGAIDASFDRIIGTPCATAVDEAACETAVAALPLIESPIFGPHTFESQSPRLQLAFTRGDSVASVGSADELRALLGTVDSAAEAALLATAGEGAWPACSRTNVRTVSDGYEVLIVVGSVCGIHDQYEVVVRVRVDGTISEVGRRLVARADPNCVIGRLTDGVSIALGHAASLGEHFARMSALEAAAVIAFERLADELESLGAPAELVARARRSARDEARHVAMVDQQRTRFGGDRVAIAVEPARARSRFEIALENATEGMVRETYGALAATYHAEHARDPEVARLFRSLAIDETRHAALARDVGEFLEASLSEAQRAEVARARADAAASLADSVAVDLGDDVHDALGWPRPEVARSMIGALFPVAWS